VRKAINEAKAAGGAAVKLSPEEQVQQAKAQQAATRTGVYKHLMTGVSYMLPFVVAGGLLIAISFALGGINVYDDAHKGTLGWTLFQIGAKSGFALMVPILAGFIAYSIADRPGIAPGMIGGRAGHDRRDDRQHHRLRFPRRHRRRFPRGLCGQIPER